MAPVTILLVDDDPLILLLGRELLGQRGYRVETAGDGAQAVQLYKSLKRVDLVILDYYLPNHNGLEVLEQLKALDPQVRVLMSSGFFSDQELKRLIEGGAQGIIYKPYRVGELEARIRSLLEDSRESWKPSPARGIQT